MSDLLIRGLSSETHAELKRRAAEAGTSLQAYVAQLLDRHTVLPTVEAWLGALDDLPRRRDLSGAEAVRAARDEFA